MTSRPSSGDPMRTSTRSVATSGWPANGDKLHGRVVARRRVVEMAPPLSTIRRLTDGVRRPARVASERVRILLDLRISTSTGAVDRSLLRRQYP
jgi:hypothetical protein